MDQETELAPEAKEVPLNKELLFTKVGLETLALISAGALQELGIVSLFLNAQGDVEVAPPGELEADGLSENDAILLLLVKGYDSGSLAGYLAGRDARDRCRADLAAKEQ